MTIDQRGSRRGTDRVPELLDQLKDVRTVLPFERSVGDEVQGLLDSAEQVVEVAMRALRTRQWYVGIGVGAVDLPLPEHPQAASGTAFVAARRAVERAKKSGDRVPLSVQMDLELADLEIARAGRAAEAVLVLVGALVWDRSVAEWRVIDELVPGVRGGQAQAAARLDITPQAVSRAVRRSGWQEEQSGRDAAALLLELADG